MLQHAGGRRHSVGVIDSLHEARNIGEVDATVELSAGLVHQMVTVEQHAKPERMAVSRVVQVIVQGVDGLDINVGRAYRRQRRDPTDVNRPWGVAGYKGVTWIRQGTAHLRRFALVNKRVGAAERKSGGIQQGRREDVAFRHCRRLGSAATQTPKPGKRHARSDYRAGQGGIVQLAVVDGVTPKNGIRGRKVVIDTQLPIMLLRRTVRWKGELIARQVWPGVQTNKGLHNLGN